MGVLAVGLVGGLLVERPRVEAGRVVGWEVAWGRSRPFATDMAGFAVSLAHLLARPTAAFPTRCRRGHLESEFLKDLVGEVGELEPLAEGQVLVWHTRAEEVNLKKEDKFLELRGRRSGEGLEV